MFRKWVSALVVVAAVFVSQANSAQCAELQGPVGLADGPGIWVNMWSYPETDVEGYVLKLHNSGIRNLFLQTSRSNTTSIQHPEILGELIDTCHRYRIRVIAWSFAELANPQADAKKLIEAANFRSPNGESFDAVAPNIEKDLEAAKVEAYSKMLREQLGPGYPMIAVVFSPLNKAAQVAKTPWKLLDKYYDVIAPMNYWNSKYAKLEPYSYTRDTIKKVRELVGRPDVEIHVIGDGMHTHTPAINEFLKACRDTSVTSASLYPFHKMTDEQYQCLTQYHQYFPVNSRFRLAAFRELVRSGALQNVKVDPSQPITRGEFYHLLATRLTGRSDMHQTESVRLLVDCGIVPEPHVQNILSTPLYTSQTMDHREAYALVANVVDARTRGHKKDLSGRPVKISKAPKRDWFALPALAQGAAIEPRTVLNYIDAAQILLSAESSLH